MSRLRLANPLPYEIGALYNRRQEIHARLGGQLQGGIATPSNSPFVILFTGEAGQQHGYRDHWEYEDGENILHYFGEGQEGDMQDSRGNRAIRQHLQNNKRLLIFQSLGKSQPYRFLGEFQFIYAYEQQGIVDTKGNLRKAIVFKLKPIDDEFNPFQNAIADSPRPALDLSATTSLHLTEIRTKQSLFKRRLLTVEKQCRVTGIADLRFLRASHIKPWAQCTNGDERIDENNGLLLSPHADFLFDRGWITFEGDGSLVRSDHLPQDVIERIGLNLEQGRKCGDFVGTQRNYLEYHRNAIFNQSFRNSVDPLSELLATSPS
ncbi:MAG: HNH endonuclease [Thermomonas sp.]|uniref:HNH endonuclease n=1 Tax=Thermomonas sp. TaxID=1971895 RepID=UPI00262845BD|nr:HNH endonuclease [Thermomonas sp.]MCC7095598.1 HNH endonuclease [Thermomonas sp.]